MIQKYSQVNSRILYRPFFGREFYKCWEESKPVSGSWSLKNMHTGDIQELILSKKNAYKHLQNRHNISGVREYYPYVTEAFSVCKGSCVKSQMSSSDVT